MMSERRWPDSERSQLGPHRDDAQRRILGGSRVARVRVAARFWDNQFFRETDGIISDIRNAVSATFQSSLQDSPCGSSFYPALEVPGYFRVVPLGLNLGLNHGRNAAVCVLRCRMSLEHEKPQPYA